MDFVTDEEIKFLDQLNLGEMELLMYSLDVYEHGKLSRSTYDEIVLHSIERNAIGFEPVN